MEIDSDVQHRCRGINALLAQNSVRDGYNKTGIWDDGMYVQEGPQENCA